MPGPLPRLAPAADPRAAAVADLSVRIADAARVGDLTLARVLSKALDELLGEPTTGDDAEVIDLASRRGRS